MENERMAADFADLMDTVNGQIRAIADAQRKRVELMATASVRDGRVTVTCNADGVPIDTEFSEDIDELDYDDIAAAVTEAAQAAAADVARQAQELIAPIQKTRSRLPSLSAMVEGLPELRAKVPEPQRASFDPPAAREQAEPGHRRRSLTDDED
ncbi:DNA-binding protein YbaB [Nocardia sp. GAS34]|jgi:DNA-binding protein YbaB